MSSFNNTNEMKRQYETSSNLNSRILLHQLFSTNKQGWSNWVFEQYSLNSNQTILELGCGNGGIWKQNADKLPQEIKLFLSDFSSGMLESAKENTSELKCVEYQVIDVQNIPFENNKFDIVIANHMLYHVPNIDLALSEISRVLKSNGTFYATTIGSNHLKEIDNLLYDFDNKIDFSQTAISKAFGLESGELKLKKYFNSVKIEKYIDSLHITEPKPLIDYILSSQGIGNINDIITEDKLKDFSDYVTSLFKEKGYLDVNKDSGIFISDNITI